MNMRPGFARRIKPIDWSIADIGIQIQLSTQKSDRIFRDEAAKSWVVVSGAVMNASATGMSPDLGRDEEESQTRDGQCGVLQFRRIGHRFSGKQHQPCVEVERDHGELKMNAIHAEPA